MQTRRGRDQLPPENGLPVVSVPAFPIENHPRSKREILIERARNFARELEASQLRTGLLEVAPQLGKLTLIGETAGATA